MIMNNELLKARKSGFQMQEYRGVGANPLLSFYVNRKNFIIVITSFVFL